MSKREKMWTNLAEWIICRYDTKSWRAGKTGKKHFSYDREVIDCLGRAALFSQAETLEQAGLLAVDWTPFHAEILKFHLDTANLDRLIAFAMMGTSHQASGFPHSDIPGSMLTYSSPRHFVVCHVLLRLLVPRHPPCALINLTFFSYFWY